MKKIYRIGVDLGGTNIATGLVDANDVVVDKLSCNCLLYTSDAADE